MSAVLPAIQVRVATADDADVLARLLAEMDDELPPPNAVDVVRELLSEMAGYPHFHCYLVFDGETPVATFSLLVFRSPSHGASRQAVLDAVVVTRFRRGQGFGEAMLKEAMRLATEAGCYKLALSSNLKRMDAHRFYETLGFAQHGISFGIPLQG